MSFLTAKPERLISKELLTKYPRRGILLFKLLEESKNNGSALNKGVQEMVITYVSALNDPDSGVLALEEIASDVDVDGQGVDQSDASNKKARAIGKLTPILTFLKKLTLTPEEINDTDVEPIFAAGWSERDFLDLVCICSVVNCINRLAMGSGLDRKMSIG
jgi:alkylhydroperoxidase family enzyme